MRTAFTEEPGTYRVLVPQKLSDERFIDDGDERRPFVVGSREVSTGDQWRPHRAEEAGRDALFDHRRQLALRQRSAGEPDPEFDRSARQLSEVAEPCDLDARQRLSPREQLFDQLVAAFLGICTRRIDVGHYQTVFVIPGVLPAQILKGAQEHAGQNQ